MDRKSQTVGVTELDKGVVLPLITAALKEDVGSRDLTTSALILKSDEAKADLIFREEGVVAGLEVAEWAFWQVDPRIRFKPLVRDGQKVYPEKSVAFVEGPARGILTAERVALNFLGRMSGIATLTQAFVEQVKRTTAQIMDTRKTTPNLRLLERYAVAVAGGIPHRLNLATQVLIKDNHLRLIAPRTGGISPVEFAVRQVRSKAQKGTLIEVEVTSLKEFRQALSAQADIVLLDNMRLAELAEAVRIRNALARSKKGMKILLEASGNVTLDNVAAIAATGVDRISIGALTHSAPALDVALELIA